MAFDGITIANMVYELNTLLSQGRISKIAQPEKDELLLTITRQFSTVAVSRSKSADSVSGG